MPYPWPYHGELALGRLALILALDRRWSSQPDREVERRLLDVVEACRDTEVRIVVVRRFGIWRTRPSGAGYGKEGGIVAVGGAALELEVPGLDGFFASSLEIALRRWGVQDLIFAGWGFEGPIHSTLRAANDRGFECLTVGDACSCFDPALAQRCRAMICHSGGIFGALAEAEALVEAVQRVKAERRNRWRSHQPK